LQEFGTSDDMQRLLDLPTFNTVAISRKMKEAVRRLDPDVHVCCKLVLLYLDALEYLGTEVTPAVRDAAILGAHKADFDATMTTVVFQAMLKLRRHSNVPFQKPNVVLKSVLFHGVKIYK